jgi:hypothetical protein
MNDSIRVAPRARLAMTALALVLVAAWGCASSGGTKTQTAGGTTAAEGGTVSSTTPTQEPDRITVQHILIGFTGSVPGKTINRTKEEARTLAYSLLERARGGEAYDALVREFTDDSWPGTYGMANRGVTPASANEYARDGMVPAFGNVGFKLAVDEFGVADYDPTTSPYGWHIIKRVK